MGETEHSKKSKQTNKKKRKEGKQKKCVLGSLNTLLLGEIKKTHKQS